MRMAAFRHVSHCYRRPTYPDWPYSVFTMVHARDREQCEETIDAIGAETGLTNPEDRAILYSTYEFKKIRLEYFTPQYEQWEHAALAGDPLPRWTRSESEWTPSATSAAEWPTTPTTTLSTDNRTLTTAPTSVTRRDAA